MRSQRQHQENGLPRWRRAALASSLAAALVATVAVGSPALADDDEEQELPVFTLQETIVDRFTDETWNPTKEFIFPSVFHAGEHLSEPLAEWYIYYAPHDAPGGINLMYADSLDGPWTQHENNPVISNEWDPYYSVSHVSSPDAFWNEEAGELFLYFHGENHTSRYATSDDGVTFTYGDTVMTTTQFGRDSTEASYARVFEHPDPESEWSYGMFFMVNDRANVRRIALALSRDGIEWEAQPGWVVEPGSAEGANVSAANLWFWEGQYYVLYGSSAGTIFARTIDPSLTEVGEVAQPLFIPEAVPPQEGRAASPEILTVDGRTHLFLEVGGRSSTTIAHAVLDPDGVRDPINTRPEDPMYELCEGAGSDSFDGDALDTDTWTRVLRDDPNAYEIADSALRLQSPPTSVGGATLIQQDVPTGPWEVTTELSYDPTEQYHQAGLMLHRDDANNARLVWGYTRDGVRFDFTWRNNGVDRMGALYADSAFPPADMGEQVWFRMTSDGTWITAAYSTDGQTFATIGRPIPVETLAPTHVGPMAYRGDTGASDATATFDWFRVTPTEDELAECEAPEPPEEFDVRVDVRQQCWADQAVVAVYAVNNGPHAIDIRFTLPDGSTHKVAGLQPDAPTYHAFHLGTDSGADGEVTVAMYRWDGEQGHYERTEVPFSAVSCG